MFAQAIVVFAGIFATLVRSNEIDDSVALLQASVEAQVHEKSDRHLADAQVDMARDYKQADSLKCEEAALPVEPADASTPAIPGIVIAETAKTSSGAAIAASDDPPGAGALRALLQFMVVLLILDGVRRMQVQKQTPAKEDTSASAQAQEAAAEAAWMELVTAATVGDAESFEKALHAEPSLTRTDAWGCTPLHFAATGGSEAIATGLLARGAEVDALDANDETPLHFAARAGHAPICEKLLCAGANSDAVNAQGTTPLVLAGLSNQESVCRLLADRGASAGGLADEELPPLVVSQLVRKVLSA